MWASQKGYDELVRILIQAGATVNAQNKVYLVMYTNINLVWTKTWCNYSHAVGRDCSLVV